MKIYDLVEHEDNSVTFTVDLTPEETQIVLEEGLKAIIENTEKDLEDEQSN